MNKKIKRLFSDTIILAFGTFASKLLVFLLLPLYTDYLSPEMYSTADLISQAANLIIPFACLGVTDAVFRFVTDKQNDGDAVLSSGMLIMLCGFVLFLALAPVLMLFDKFDGYVWLILLYVLAADVHSLFAQYIRASGKTALFAWQGIINTGLTIGLNVLFLVKFGMGIIGYVLSVIIADAAVSIILLLGAGLFRHISQGKINGALIFQMLKYCLPLIPTVIFWWVTNVSDRYIVAEICGDSINGLYSAAYKIPTLITLASAVFNEAWQFFAFSGDEPVDEKTAGTDDLPGKSVASAATEDTKAKASKRKNAYYYGKTFAAFSTVMILVCSFLIMISGWLCGKLFAESYIGVEKYVPTLLLATVFTSLVTFLSSIYALAKKTVMSFVTAAAGAIINIVLNIIFIPKFGAEGAAIATFICYFVVFVIRSYNTKQYLEFRIYSPIFVISVVIIIVQCILAWFVPGIIGQIITFAALLIVNLPVILDTCIAVFPGISKIFKKNKPESSKN